MKFKKNASHPAVEKLAGSESNGWGNGVGNAAVSLGIIGRSELSVGVGVDVVFRLASLDC